MIIAQPRIRFAAGARVSLASPLPRARVPCGSCFKAILAATVFAASMPVFPATIEHLEAALILIQPPSDSELEQILDLSCEGNALDTAAAERLEEVYRSLELRRRIAEIYTRYLTLEDLRHLQKAFDSRTFRKYKSVAPLIFAEVLALEEDMLSRHGIGTTHCPSRTPLRTR